MFLGFVQPTCMPLQKAMHQETSLARVSVRLQVFSFGSAPYPFYHCYTPQMHSLCVHMHTRKTCLVFTLPNKICSFSLQALIHSSQLHYRELCPFLPMLSFCTWASQPNPCSSHCKLCWWQLPLTSHKAFSLQKSVQ